MIDILRQATLRSLLIEAGQVVSGLSHHLHHLIEAHPMLTIREVGIGVSIQRTGSRKGVSLDTGDLHQATYRIAGLA